MYFCHLIKFRSLPNLCTPESCLWKPVESSRSAI
jgi:hypothetical protein